jgi:hypothetical protein
MRRIGKLLAIATLTGGAVLGGLAITGPAFAGGGGSGQSGLVNIYAQNLLNGDQVILLQNVPVSLAATVCGLTTNVLSNELASGNHADCTAKDTSVLTSWVSNN